VTAPLRVRAILNPRAGVRALRAREALLRPRDAWRLEIAETERPGHARDLARESAARGDDAVLAVGGDGTANEVASGLIGTSTALGIVPMGSGNGLARALGIPLRPRPALDALESAVVRRMDVASVNGLPFLNVAGAGFDAAVGAAFHDHTARGGRRGIFTYVRMGLRSIFTYRAETCLLEMEGQRFEGRALLVTFANGRQYGAEAQIAPGSRLDDGLLDVVVLEDAPLHELLIHAPRLFMGGLEGFRRYRRFPATRAVLTADLPLLFHRDGEPEPPAARLEVEVLPRALDVLVPRATARDPTGPFAQAEP
jgi:YegS/Rv2252/BmrU family lipid kinase